MKRKPPRGDSPNRRASRIRGAGPPSERASSGAEAAYLYCLATSDRKPRIGTTGARLPDSGPPRALDAGDSLWLVVSSVRLADYGKGVVEKKLRDVDWLSDVAMGHAAVVAGVARHRDVVPVQMLTIFESDAGAVARINRNRRTVERVRTLVRGCEEWGIRVEFDPERMPLRGRSGSAEKAGPGASFLMKKERAYLRSRGEVPRDARSAAAAIGAKLSDRARAKQLRAGGAPRPSGRERVLLDAIYLIPRDQREAFVALANDLDARSEGKGVRVVVTGPFPPYSFVKGGL